MFTAPFSSKGRITRTEYGLSLILYTVAYCIIASAAKSDTAHAIAGLAFIPLCWFIVVQGAKRCHDFTRSGWMQFIPLFIFWMLFEESTYGPNKYGENPKGMDTRHTTDNYATAATSAAISQTVQTLKPENRSATQTRIPENQLTVLEVDNVNFSLVQDLLKKLRALELTSTLSYEFFDTSARIAVRHYNTSQVLLDHLYPVVDNMQVLGVSSGSLKIKIK